MTPIEEYCAAHTSMPDDGIYQVFRSVALHTANPNMASSPYQGVLLQMLASIVQPEIAVEVGSHAGYGSACLARGMDGHGTLHLIESNEEYEPLIRKHILMAGMGENIQLHIAPAIQVIPTLPTGIGLAFVDADKENYPLYYSLLLPKMKKGGIMLFDNMLWYGRVLDSPEAESGSLRCERETRVIQNLNTIITDDPRVDNILLPIRDGIMLCRIK